MFRGVSNVFRVDRAFQKASLAFEGFPGINKGIIHVPDCSSGFQVRSTGFQMVSRALLGVKERSRVSGLSKTLKVFRSFQTGSREFQGCC